MKVKSLALLLSAGLFAATASATSVVLYGNLDAAVVGNYTKTVTSGKSSVTFILDGKPAKSPISIPPATNKESKTQNYVLSNGLLKGSYLGFKGDANITATSFAGFQLELGFSSMNGGFSKSLSLFNRGASVYVQGDFGRLAFGYQPDMVSAYGSNNAYARVADPFVHFGVGASSNAGRMVYNSLTYQTPTIAGLTLQALFSPDATNLGNSFKHNVRLAQVGLNFAAGPVELAVVGTRTFYPKGQTILLQQNKDYKPTNVVEQQFYDLAFPSLTPTQEPLIFNKKDSSQVRAAANLTLGSVKLFASGEKSWKGVNNMNGWGASTGFSVQSGKHLLLADVAYAKYNFKYTLSKSYVSDPNTPKLGNQVAEKPIKMDQNVLGARLVYAYQLGQNATLYFGAAYNKTVSKLDVSTNVQHVPLKITGDGEPQYKFFDLYQNKKAKTTETTVQGFIGASVSF